MIRHFGGGVFATVMDSYDYERALAEVIPAVAAEQVEAGGFWVLRPDSGDPTDAVVAALEAADRAFGSDINAKGFRVPRGVGVIQGDGIQYPVLREILAAVLARGYSAEVRGHFHPAGEREEGRAGSRLGACLAVPAGVRAVA